MYLSRLFISNYRSIDTLDLNFNEGKNVVVGKNNAGKSNIIRAIDLVLGESAPTYEKSDNITSNDFHNNDLSKNISILVELVRNPGETLDYDSINKCYGYYVLGSGGFRGQAITPDRFLLRKTHDALLSDFEALFDIDFDDAQKAYVNPKKDTNAFKDQLEDKYRFAYLFSARYDSDTDKIVKDMRFLYREDENVNWVVAQRASVRNELLQSAIIPAFRDPYSQLRATSYTWYGKLLQKYVDAKNPKLKEAFDGVKDASNEVFGRLQEKINDSRVKVAFPDTEIAFQFNPETKQDVYKSALIYVNDGFNSLLQDKGSGIQSAVIVGLFDFYVRNVAHVSGSLLAIEEPELYLHPHGRRIISHRLEDFLEGNKNQVIITTHSTEFITASEKDLHIILVKKKGGKTTAKETIFTNPKEKRLLLKGQNAEMFFADHVVLVEGGEKYIFEVAAKKFGIDNSLGENWLDEKNISVISVSGKGEFLKYTQKLDQLEVTWSVFADFDFLRRGLCEFLTGRGIKQADTDRVNALKSEIAADSTTLSEYKKISEVPTKFHERVKELMTVLKKKGVFMFSGELEDFYKEKANTECPGLGKEEKAICIATEINNTNVTDFLNNAELNDALSMALKQIEK